MNTFPKAWVCRRCRQGFATKKYSYQPLDGSKKIHSLCAHCHAALVQADKQFHQGKGN